MISKTQPKSSNSTPLFGPLDYNSLNTGLLAIMCYSALSHVWLFATLWTVPQQASLSMEFPRQEYWMSCHFQFEGIFLTEGANLGLLHCRKILYHWAIRFQAKHHPWLLNKYDKLWGTDHCGRSASPNAARKTINSIEYEERIWIFSFLWYKFNLKYHTKGIFISLVAFRPSVLGPIWLLMRNRDSLNGEKWQISLTEEYKKSVETLPARRWSLIPLVLKVSVMTNFICHLDWVWGCPDMWPNIILGVCMRVYLDEINIYISRLSKANYPPQCGLALPNQLKAWIKQKGWPPLE